MYHILVVEDDQDIAAILKLYLENAKYKVFCASDGKTAYDIFRKETIDLAIIDLMIPEMDGNSLTKAIRLTSSIPIMILSAKKEDLDKVFSLNIGADDYITKPFNSLEVLARVNAHLRRYHDLNPKATASKVLTIGNLMMDSERFLLEKAGQKITLTAKEFKLLHILMESPGRIFTKSQLYDMINDQDARGDESTIMTHISNIRDKIEEDAKNPRYIKTIRGVGYKIEKT
ncbi:response regulator transcription factor [Streptococcus merionis]|uniref:Transcriptional regulatory protein DltR n=1 Tax=Streptococcus merionis TaxID=400065 RepID=A0A239SRU6_9STRE|nr:response regulator transcription factor [Streptococcus merionis]SNU87444.1 two-component response regulator [Streptococcus merionis]